MGGNFMRELSAKLIQLYFSSISTMPSKDVQIENMAMADFYKIPQNPSSVIKSGKY
jgi:hypothetical protein